VKGSLVLITGIIGLVQQQFNRAEK